MNSEEKKDEVIKQGKEIAEAAKLALLNKFCIMGKINAGAVKLAAADIAAAMAYSIYNLTKVDPIPDITKDMARLFLAYKKKNEEADKNEGKWQA